MNGGAAFLIAVVAGQHLPASTAAGRGTDEVGAYLIDVVSSGPEGLSVVGDDRTSARLRRREFNPLPRDDAVSRCDVEVKIWARLFKHARKSFGRRSHCALGARTVRADEELR